MSWFYMWSFLGSKVNKSSQILIKTLNAMKYIESDVKKKRHQEKIILSSNMYDKIYLQGSVEGVLRTSQVSSL